MSITAEAAAQSSIVDDFATAPPPAAGRSMRHLPFRRSAILPGGFFMSLEHYGVISYDIKKQVPEIIF